MSEKNLRIFKAQLTADYEKLLAVIDQAAPPKLDKHEDRLITYNEPGKALEVAFKLGYAVGKGAYIRPQYETNLATYKTILDD